MIRPLLAAAAAALVVGLIGCGGAPEANPKASPDAKAPPGLQPASQSSGDAAAPSSGAAPTGPVNQP